MTITEGRVGHHGQCPIGKSRTGKQERSRALPLEAKNDERKYREDTATSTTGSHRGGKKRRPEVRGKKGRSSCWCCGEKVGEKEQKEPNSG